ncbi:Stimulated by retinoic acid gene 6 protein-like [Apodemus speciosus]|uniref:Stimulated by retinoic acid gene 6 protein-like n=1 Tax=Apodemus speciosus TaxID=105296 RepID=A0ABQ0EN29_APOSI
MLTGSTRTRQLNVTCDNSLDRENFLHYSLIPSISSSFWPCLSFKDESIVDKGTTPPTSLGNHFGIIVPLDFLGTFSNRWSYGAAFGATANKVMFLFSEGYQPLKVPQWAQAFVLLIGGMEVGLSYFPFFACLSSEFPLVSSILGFAYSLTWFVVTVLQISQCPHGQFLGRFETLIFYWPSLLCLSFLLGRFLHMFLKALPIYLGLEPQTEEKSMLEAHQAEHVKQLLRKPRPQEGGKSWFQTRVYEWDPCFQFPSRMIGTLVLASICLYLFIVIEICVFILVRDKVDMFEDKLESYLTHMNETGALTPVILQVKELISITKGVWVVTILPAALTCVTYLFHILACYRKHMKRLWAGEKHFLPQKFHSPSSAASVVAIARYSGWQIAYILWGYLIIHVVQSLCGVTLMYSLVLPIIHHQGLEMLQGFGLGVLTISIVVGLIILQVWDCCHVLPAAQAGHRRQAEAPGSQQQGRAFHNFNYFLFFYNVLLGLGACLSRLFISCLLGTWLIARIDRTIMQSGYESADMALSSPSSAQRRTFSPSFGAWVGMLFVDHYHTNPVLVSFCHILITSHKDGKLKKTVKYLYLNQTAGSPILSQSQNEVVSAADADQQSQARHA